MKHLVLVIFVLGANSFASQFGSYSCHSVRVFKEIVVQLNLDTHQILYRHAEDDPAIPSKWKAIFKNSEVFCGYAPSKTNDIECPFNTSFDPATNNVVKNLACMRIYDDGTRGAVTSGMLSFNIRNGTGSLKCSIFSNKNYDLILSQCRRL